MDLGPFACRVCAGPLRYGTRGLRCIQGIVPAPADCPTGLRPGVDCDGLVEPTRTRPRDVEVFVCSCRCGRRVKLRVGDARPERVCERGGILIFDRVQSR